MTNKDQLTIRECLEDSLRSAYWHGELKNANGVLTPILEEALKTIETKILDVIGEDDNIPKTHSVHIYHKEIRNKLRQEQRKRLKDLTHKQPTM